MKSALELELDSDGANNVRLATSKMNKVVYTTISVAVMRGE